MGRFGQRGKDPEFPRQSLLLIDTGSGQVGSSMVHAVQYGEDFAGLPE